MVSDISYFCDRLFANCSRRHCCLFVFQTCESYWPAELGSQHHYGPFTVELIHEDRSIDDIIIRDLALTYNKKVRSTSWAACRTFVTRKHNTWNRLNCNCYMSQCACWSFQSEVLHPVRQFQFTAWKDPVGVPVPDSRSSLIHLLHLVEKWQQRSGNSVITVHCL